MTDPLPEKPLASDKPLAYNTTPRPRPKKWFRAPSQVEGYYSPFWPLMIVFLAYIVLLVYEISFLRSRSVTTMTQLTRLSDTVQKIKAQDAFVQGLRADLQALAPTHPDAAMIVKEFFAPQTAPASPLAEPDASKPPDPAASAPAK